MTSKYDSLTMFRFPDLKAHNIVHDRKTLKSWIKYYGFPKPIAFGPRAQSWRVLDVEAWIKRRENGDGV